MSRKRKIIKWSLIIFASLIVSLVSFGYWFISLLEPTDPTSQNIENTTIEDLPYITNSQPPPRGRILAVVTSQAVMGETEKSTGYELTELARAYYVFLANGFEVDVASPQGGKPPVVIDDDDMGEFDYAFLNDREAQSKVNNTINIKDIQSEDYEAVYFVGGKGAMFDFPNNKHIHKIVREYYEAGKVIGAVCHGPAALVNVRLSDGSHLLKGKTVSAFTNEEELFLIENAPEIFPFLLQDKLIENGAKFNEGLMYLEKVSQDGKLITGQNPWSVWAMAEQLVQQLGYEPKKRIKTGEENAVKVLNTFEHEGYAQAKATITNLIGARQSPLNRELIAIHSIVAAMQWDLIRAVKLIGLLYHAKSQSQVYVK